MSATTSADRSERVTAVLVRAAALSDELRTTIQELERILRRPDEELESIKPTGKGE